MLLRFAPSGLILEIRRQNRRHSSRFGKLKVLRSIAQELELIESSGFLRENKSRTHLETRFINVWQTLGLRVF